MSPQGQASVRSPPLALGPLSWQRTSAADPQALTKEAANRGGLTVLDAAQSFGPNRKPTCQFVEHLLVQDATGQASEVRNSAVDFDALHMVAMARGLERAPSGLDRNAIVVIDRTRAGRIAPIPGVIVAELRRALELRFGDSGDIAAEVGIVFQRLPGQRIVVVANPQKSTEAQHGVGHLAAHLVDHNALDGSDLRFVGAVNRSAFNLVTANQITLFLYFRYHFILLGR
jgi:hypothetical protein